MQKKDPKYKKGVLSELNDDPVEKKRKGTSDKKKGIIADLNGPADKKK
ncbi:hypothetical protein [Mongoliibacter ruber]|nr:hypothetical protein [Mongoliibacter ruber]